MGLTFCVSAICSEIGFPLESVFQWAKRVLLILSIHQPPLYYKDIFATFSFISSSEGKTVLNTCKFDC